MRKLKRNSGITLIALVITIIVLLILASVTINLTIGQDGILIRAQEAGKKYTNAAEDEQKQLADLMDQTDKIISNITESNIVGSKENIKITGITFGKTQLSIAPDAETVLNLTIKPESASNKELEWISSNPSVATVDNGKVKAVSVGTTTITAIAKDGSEVSSNCTINVTTVPLASAVEVGDYVAYDPTEGVTNTNKLTYISPVGTGTSHGNGSKEQTFTANSKYKWRVLSKNESTGEVILISSTFVKAVGENYAKVKGAIGYLYSEQELNSICAIYGYGKGADTTKTYTYQTGGPKDTLKSGTITSGARSINANDVNMITGYNPETYKGASDTLAYGSEASRNVLYPTITTESGWSVSNLTDKLTSNYYWYNVSDLENINNKKAYDVLSSQDCSLATRVTMLSTAGANGVVSWSDMKAYGNIVGPGSSSVTVDEYENKASNLERSWYPRPLVYLKTTVQTNGKNDSGAWIIID